MSTCMDPAPRRSLRIPLPVETLRTEDGAPRFLGYLENISTSGVFIQCASPRAEGTRLSVRMRLPGLATPLDAVGLEVVWTRGYRGRNGPAPGMGLRFVEPAGGALGEVRKFCETSDPHLHPVTDPTADGTKPL